jgi:hypothetical protein
MYKTYMGRGKDQCLLINKQPLATQAVIASVGADRHRWNRHMSQMNAYWCVLVRIVGNIETKGAIHPGRQLRLNKWSLQARTQDAKYELSLLPRRRSSLISSSLTRNDLRIGSLVFFSEILEQG